MPGFAALLPSIITAGGSLLGSMFGFGSQAKTNKDNMKLAEYQYSKNLEMWQRQNEYNTPFNQRKRLVEAGLNPALMYGSGKVANVASDATQFQAPTLQAYNNFGDLGAAAAVNSYSAFEHKLKEIENISADTEQKKSLNAWQIVSKFKTLAEIASINLQNSKTRTEREFWYSNAKFANEAAREEVENRKKEGKRIDASTDLLDAQKQTEDELRDPRVSNEVKRGQLIEAQTKTEGSKQGYYSSETSKNKATEHYYTKLGQLTDVQIAKCNEEVEVLKRDIERLDYKKQQRFEHEIEILQAQAAKAQSDAETAIVQQQLDKTLKKYGIDPRKTGIIDGPINQSMYMLLKMLERLNGNN